MIFSTTTKVVSNYDSDVFFPVQTYVDVVNSIIDDEFDFVYPYLLGQGQKQLYYSKWYESKFAQWVFYPMWKFIQDWDINIFDDDSEHVKMWASAYGHSIFADTNKYKAAFGENEEFISYGPEDQERAYRFQKLGYNVNWYNGYVYHIEHMRTNDSSIGNPQFNKNCEIFEHIKTLNKDELLDYYKNITYLKKYNSK
jgi:predicted glycosyltransferase involved in capsule biosynthesis